MTTTTSTNAKQEFRDQAKVVGDEIREFGKQGKAAAREVLSDAADSASDYYSAGKERAGDYLDHVSGYVRTNPVKSLLIAAGAGAVLAFLTRRR